MATGGNAALEAGSGFGDNGGQSTNSLPQRTPPETLQPRISNSPDDEQNNGLLGRGQGSQSNYFLLSTFYGIYLIVDYLICYCRVGPAKLHFLS